MTEVKDGALARMGLLSAASCAAAEEVIARAAEDGLETVRILFADQHGILRGKTLVAGALRSAFTSGVAIASTLLLKDSSNRTVFQVWDGERGTAPGPMQGANDVLLVPDPVTFRRLPWSPHSAWILCDVVFRDGRPVPFSSRGVLRQAMDALAARQMTSVIGLEVEFHVFRKLRDGLEHSETGTAGAPGAPVETAPLNRGFEFLSEAPYAEAEPILDDLRRNAQGLGLPVRSVEIEIGPSQFEFTFDPASPMEQADNLVMFRAMVKAVCARRGLHASFMAKPRLPNIAANGWHIHQSLLDAGDGRNLFTPGADDGPLSPQAAGWVAGLLKHAAASSLMTVPTVNGYKRYQPYQMAPNRIQWGMDNRGAMVRALTAPGDPASRVENRAPDSAANPYFALASQLISGLDGIASGLVPPPATTSPYDGPAEKLPDSMAEAITAFDAASVFRETLGEDFVSYLLQIKRAEWERYLATVSEWEQTEYFNLF
ncbi:glutamine synthetase family protein [Antarcticimicrobium luteum]|uniref:Glutamine synthetase n=1 Tax=Antarcticimicrobium luteum TaxID=2547397 RepID=A0A4R5VHW8_9RHOB|nr:glutamine synthetase family protein [Antarcticimicrobium luteum]TDK52132.1 glutamine synthetase [Antarcticimicrobium luteum]